MCGEGENLIIGSSLEFLKLPIIPEVEPLDDDEVVLESDSEREIIPAGQPLLNPIKREKPTQKWWVKALAIALTIGIYRTKHRRILYGDQHSE